MKGVGAGGATGLMMTADGTGFKTSLGQQYAGFGVHVTAFANRAAGVDTTDLNRYKLYATIRTTGQIGPAAHGRVQWQFLTPGGVILTVSLNTTFTSSDQRYSFCLGEGTIDLNSGGSLKEFLANFDRIDRVQCAVDASNWLTDYGPDADNALYISEVRFVRLEPSSLPPPSTAKSSGDR